jgi:hypothetical protein
MPTPGTKFFELLLGVFPTWIGIIGISLALLLPLVQSCREWARDDAAKALPQDNAVSDPWTPDTRHLLMATTESTLLPPDLMAQLERLELVTRKGQKGDILLYE